MCLSTKADGKNGANMQVKSNKYLDIDFYRNIQTKFGIIGSSSQILDVVYLLNQAAPTDLPVLITGETGTGKEVFSKALHGLSKRKKEAFISVNCGAIPETLLESELFGHERGAFTGAVDKRNGFFEVADRGTLFLDEIGEMPLSTQVKLLRVLETGEFSSLGSSAIKKVDVRIVAATNRNLEEEVAQGNFRQDLFYRLKSVIIHLPPLREHPEDIEELVRFYAVKACKKIETDYKGISPEALEFLQSRPWEGNIRELRNLIETAIALENCNYLNLRNIKPYADSGMAAPPSRFLPLPEKNLPVPQSTRHARESAELEIIFRTLLEIQNQIANLERGMQAMSFKLQNIEDNLPTNAASDFQIIHDEEARQQQEPHSLNLEENEIILIKSALAKYSGSRHSAAMELGISERTLYRKLKQYNLEN